ncbi:MAG: hypothetical protein AAB973_02460 [Patescibacteria group bacterium]
MFGPRIEREHRFAGREVKSWLALEGERLPLGEFVDPYGLDYGFMVFDPGVEKLLGEVEPWEHLPFYVQGPARDGLSAEQERALVWLGLATNLQQKNSLDWIRMWGDCAVFLARSARRPSRAMTVISMHRAETYLSKMAGFSIDKIVNVKRLHAENDPSKIAAAITQDSLKVFPTRWYQGRGQLVEVNDPFIATGASLKALFLYWFTTDNLPRKVITNCIFCTQQGVIEVRAFALSLGLEWEVRSVKMMRRMNESGYVMYTKDDPLGWQVSNLRRSKFGEMNEITENQAGGDAGDNLQAYYKMIK